MAYMGLKRGIVSRMLQLSHAARLLTDHRNSLPRPPYLHRKGAIVSSTRSRAADDIRKSLFSSGCYGAEHRRSVLICQMLVLVGRQEGHADRGAAAAAQIARYGQITAHQTAKPLSQRQSEPRIVAVIARCLFLGR